MEIVFRVCLFLTGVINFLPSLLAILPDKISQSYGIQVPDVNSELLLRHRAILFAIVGGFMIYASLSKSYYDAASLFGLVSMLSFVLLYLAVGSNSVNTELTKVMWLDVAGLAILMVGYSIYRFGK